MKGVKAIVISALMLSSSLVIADPAATIHLRLYKDTLSLAEPTCLTAEITNNSNKDLVLFNGPMFGLQSDPYLFSLFLINPFGEEWSYSGSRGLVNYDYLPSPTLWYLIPPGKSVSNTMLATWTDFVPDEYQEALEKLPTGTYKLYATFEIPEEKVGHKFNRTVYSDTIEFVFLPPRWEDFQALVIMDSLRWFYRAGGARRDVDPFIRHIMETHTSYSECAHALHVSLIGSSTNNIDSLMLEKAIFDKAYPGSQFEVIILNELFGLAFQPEYKERVDAQNTVIQDLSIIEPNDPRVLLKQGKIRHPRTLEEIK